MDNQIEHIRWFLRTLHPLPNHERLVQFVALKGKASQLLWLWLREQEDQVIADLIALNAAGWSVYIGVNPRATMAGGERENIAATTSLVIDFDARATGGDFQLVLKELHRLAFPAPSILVNSGNGHHGYWLLDKDADDAETVNERLCALCASDDVWNASRIMRLPGTVNWKQPATWCVAEKITSEMHKLTDIDKHLADVGIPDFGPEPLPPAPENPPADLQEAIELVPGQIREIILTGRAGGFQSNSEVDWAVCCALVEIGCTNQQIQRVFSTYPAGGLKVSSSPASYLERTLVRARSEVARVQASRARMAALPQPPFVQTGPGRFAIQMTEVYSVRNFYR